MVVPYHRSGCPPSEMDIPVGLLSMTAKWARSLLLEGFAHIGFQDIPYSLGGILGADSVHCCLMDLDDL